MLIATVVILIIFLGVCLCANLCLSYSINNIKGSLDDIKYKCDNASEIKTTEYMLHDCITKSHKELLTEIACLATKNNEDIKRMKGFQVGDVIEYGGEEMLVLDRQMMTLNNKENLTDYIIWNKTEGMQQETASHLEHNAKFLRHVNLKE